MEKHLKEIFRVILEISSGRPIGISGLHTDNAGLLFALLRCTKTGLGVHPLPKMNNKMQKNN